MASSNYVFMRMGDTCAWISLNDRTETWSAETMVRLKGGIRYRDREYGINMPTIDRLREDAISGGFFSQRPFAPSVAGDPSMRDCALTLFVNFCASRGVDGFALVQAHVLSTGREIEDFQQISAQAEWEGIDLPPIWNALWIDALEQVLDDVCCEYLAEYVARIRS